MTDQPAIRSMGVLEWGLLVTLLVPVSAIILGALFLGERLAPQHVIGMAAITLSLAAIDGRLPARFGRRRAPG